MLINTVRAAWLMAGKRTGTFRKKNPDEPLPQGRHKAPFPWLLSRNIEAFDRHFRIFSAAFLRKLGS